MGLHTQSSMPYFLCYGLLFRQHGALFRLAKNRAFDSFNERYSLCSANVVEIVTVVPLSRSRKVDEGNTLERFRIGGLPDLKRSLGSLKHFCPIWSSLRTSDITLVFIMVACLHSPFNRLVQYLVSTQPMSFGHRVGILHFISPVTKKATRLHREKMGAVSGPLDWL